MLRAQWKARTNGVSRAEAQAREALRRDERREREVPEHHAGGGLPATASTAARNRGGSIAG